MTYYFPRYPGSNYAFCGICRITFEPVLCETEKGVFEVCPMCIGKVASREADEKRSQVVECDLCHEEASDACPNCKGKFCQRHFWEKMCVECHRFWTNDNLY